MNTLFLTTQIVCYGVGILSASLNIASFVRRRRVKQRRVRARRSKFASSNMDGANGIASLARRAW